MNAKGIAETPENNFTAGKMQNAKGIDELRGPLLIGGICMLAGFVAACFAVVQTVSTRGALLQAQLSANDPTLHAEELRVATLDYHGACLSALICGIAAVAYSVMSRLRARLRDAVHIESVTETFAPDAAGVNLGALKQAIYLRTTQLSDDAANVNRLVVGMRHVDWALTLPLLAIEVFLLLRHPHPLERDVRSQMWGAAALAFFCIVFGYMAHPLSVWATKERSKRSNHCYFALACASFVGMYLLLFLDINKALDLYKAPFSATEHKWLAGTLFAALWLFYPFVAFYNQFCKSGAADDPDPYVERIYAVLDVVSKAGLALFHLWYGLP